MPLNNFNIKGLTHQQVILARKQHGNNQLTYKRENGFLGALKNLAKEPMVVLLLATSSIYFMTGSVGDGIFLASAIILVSAISLYQDSRSRRALEELKNFTESSCKVIRDGEIQEIRSDDLVVGDSLVAEEGALIAADGVITHSNDFSVNESILTGESLPVYKDQAKADNVIFRGTTVASGLVVATITATGNQTQLGKIGKSLESIKQEKTPLELQISNFVKWMVVVGAAIFVVVWLINYYRSHSVLDSLLKALTLAMSILPEEIPVAFTTFMALGAWRLMQMGIIVKNIKTVETLGSASIICTDKTGTITENKMSFARLFSLVSKRISDPKDPLYDDEKELIKTAMWASEPIPFDPMEIALHNAYSQVAKSDDRSDYKLVHEYPLEGRPPMMTHVFKNDAANFIIAAKGAPESVLNASNLPATEKNQIEEVIKALAIEGFRVLGVAKAKVTGDDLPAKQEEFNFDFIGLVAFYDPPKKNIQSVFQSFYDAGIGVKIVTGDNTPTTVAIAKQIGLRDYDKSISGHELMAMDDVKLQESVSDKRIFTRMFPDAKLKIINALKARNQVVAMTGDGVNDGPALKAAHIGIAMGKKGTEIAKQAASLILVDDDLSKMIDAVAMGRRIYGNLKKAIQYIISIHIPIILTVFIPLAFGWRYPNIFSPVHIIFLELIMGPTCSIIYENEPIEKNAMLQKPRPFTTTFFNWWELTTSIIQGLVITLGTLLVYQYSVKVGFSESQTRTMVFTVLIAANIFLTLVNRSFYYSFFTTLRYKNNLVLMIIGMTITISVLLIFVEPLASFFAFEPLNLFQLSISIGVAFLFVIWYELVKFIKRSADRVPGKS